MGIKLFYSKARGKNIKSTNNLIKALLNCSVNANVNSKPDAWLK